MTENRHADDGKGATTATGPNRESNAGAPPTPHTKAKRTLTPDNFIRTVANVMVSGPALFEAAVKPKISLALREKLFLAVTSINDCRYCKWGHSHWAMAQGVSLEEVNQILSHQIDTLTATNPAEAAAILFAQHYAEQLDHFEPESVENLRIYYSEAQVDEILAYVRFITLTNLTGNTVDSFLGRFRGQDDTTSLFEGMVATFAAPLAFVLMQCAKFDCQVSMDKLRPTRADPSGMPASNLDSKGPS